MSMYYTCLTLSAAALVVAAALCWRVRRLVAREGLRCEECGAYGLRRLYNDGGPAPGVRCPGCHAYYALWHATGAARGGRAK